MSTTRGLLWAICAIGVLCPAGCGRKLPPAPQASQHRSEASASPRQTRRVEFVSSFDEGCRQATQQGKPLLILFTTRWCDYCRSMADEAFTDPQVVNLAERFVCVEVDADANVQVCHDFRVRHYPTIQFLSPRGVPLTRLTGKQTAGHLTREMQAALQAIAQRPPPPAKAVR